LSAEGVEKLKYLGTTLIDKNCMKEEIKEPIKFRECLLTFGPESSVFPPAV
jgi:hypothetical protein